MLEFEWAWLAVVLPSPLLSYFLLPPNKANQAALKLPFLADFKIVAIRQSLVTERSWLLTLASVAWLCLVLAAMRPQWLGEPVDIPTRGRNLMLAVDISSSMELQDFVLQGKQVDRLTATKAVVEEFVSKRAGDRIGLILFGSQAYLQVPMTFDKQTMITLLNEAAIGLAGQKTAIGDAIGLTVKRLRNAKTEDKVLILLTDGKNTAGTVAPDIAATFAAEENLKIYTIGIGADSMLVRDFFGSRRFNPSAELDEEMLISIAEKTGGRYFRARDTETFQDIYRLLDEIEKIEEEPLRFRPKITLFYWPLAGALMLMVLILLLQLRGGKL